MLSFRLRFHGSAINVSTRLGRASSCPHGTWTWVALSFYRAMKYMSSLTLILTAVALTLGDMHVNTASVATGMLGLPQYKCLSARKMNRPTSVRPSSPRPDWQQRRRSHACSRAKRSPEKPEFDARSAFALHDNGDIKSPGYNMAHRCHGDLAR